MSWERRQCQKSEIWTDSIAWVAKLCEDPWGDGARCPELLLPGTMGSGLGVRFPGLVPRALGSGITLA